MNRWTLMRNNLLTALQALPFPRDVVFKKLASAKGIEAVIGPRVIGVCLYGDRWVMPSEIGDHTNQPAQMTAQIVIGADNAVDSVDAIEEIDELASIALTVRNVDIGIYGMGDDLDTGGVYLDGMRSDILEFTGREPGGAGPIAKVFSLSTTVLPL